MRTTTLKSPSRLLFLTLLILFIACDEDSEFEPAPDVISSDEYVDLRPQQSSLKNQGSRTTCIVFAGVAAVEAAYKKFGYGEVDLSEEFINFTRKAFYLHPIWTDHETDGVNRRETQLGSSGGGGGVGVVAELTKSHKIPLEEVMPYQNSDNFYLNNYPVLQQILDKGSAATQRDYSDFNLDPSILTSEILLQEEWYGVGSYLELNNPRDTDEIENVLKRKSEVVWDFAGSDPQDPRGVDDRNTWQKCDDCATIGHSMLIVGFDKRDPNPDKHYFIVKNSWGGIAVGDDMDGYTTISYEYVKSYGRGAAYIRWPAGPTEWPEVAFIGRWKLNYDGFKGELDIYHIPGMSEYSFEYNFGVGAIPEIYEDYRIGTYYDAQGNAFRINGSLQGNKLEFYIDGSTPLLRWDKISGTRYVYYLYSDKYMAGFHQLENGAEYAGYGKKELHLEPGTQTPRPFNTQSYYNSQWRLEVENVSGTLEFDAIVSGEFDNHVLLEGTYTTGSSVKAQLKFYPDDPAKVYIQVANINGSAMSFIGRHLSWEAGLITGHTPETVNIKPFSMIRLN